MICPGMTADQPMSKIILFAYVGSVSLVFLVSGLSVYLFEDMVIDPVLTAWGVASINFALALWSMTLAQRSEPVYSMLLVFGGGGVRMLLMIGAVIVVAIKRAEWMMPFCIVLLFCFVSFLIIEILIIYRRGLVQHLSHKT